MFKLRLKETDRKIPVDLNNQTAKEKGSRGKPCGHGERKTIYIKFHKTFCLKTYERGVRLGFCSLSSTCQAWSCEPGLCCTLYMWGSLLLVQRESHDFMGIMRQRRFFASPRSEMTIRLSHTPASQPASRPSHDDTQKTTLMLLEHVIGAYVCVCVCLSANVS